MIRQANQRSWDMLAGVLLVAGYINVGSVSIGPASFSFSLRGPVFWRLSQGLPPYLHSDGTGVGSAAYKEIEFLLAMLLFWGEAHIDSGTVVASAIILRVDSPLFRWKRADRILRGKGPFYILLRSLLNFVVGAQLAFDQLPFVITGVRYSPEHRLEFSTTGTILQRVEGCPASSPCPGRCGPACI